MEQNKLNVFFCWQGPVLAWLNCIEAMQEIGMEIPVNLKVCVKVLQCITLYLITCTSVLL